jgi:geranylgeranyl diphosphate synthase type I
VVDAPEILRRYRDDIAVEVARALPKGSSRLDEMLRYQLGWSEDGLPTLGKALRPSLCLFICESLDGDLKQALPVAVAIELIHNFSLIHDDVEDGDTLRHHRPTLWHAYGRDEALVAGIALWTLAYETLEGARERGVPAETVIEARRVLNDACCEMIEGQHLDLTYEQRSDVTLDEYLHMVRGKTAALIGASLQTGALLAGVGRPEAEQLGVFGRELGLTFQIRDDILGIWGEGSATGKPVGADLARKKKTLPVVHAFQHAVGPDRDILRTAYARPVVSEQDVDDVLDVLQRWNCRYFAQGLAQDYRSRAMAALAQTALLPPTARRELDELTSFILERDY